MSRPNEKPGGKKPYAPGQGGGLGGGKGGNNNNNYGQNSQSSQQSSYKPRNNNNNNPQISSGQISKDHTPSSQQQSGNGQGQQWQTTYERRNVEQPFQDEIPSSQNRSGNTSINNRNNNNNNTNPNNTGNNNSNGSQSNSHFPNGGNNSTSSSSSSNNNNNNNTGGLMDRKKKGLGKNKFHQIYTEIANNRQNGIELGDMRWLSELRMQFPQIFSAEHLAPIFVDKGFTDRFNAAEAFERQDKKKSHGNGQAQNRNDYDRDGPSSAAHGGGGTGGYYHNNNSNSTNNNNKNNNNNNKSNINPNHQQHNPSQSNANNFHQQEHEVYNQSNNNKDDNVSSGSNPEWEVDENDFDFEFKTFDKEKHAQQMKEQQERYKNNSQRSNYNNNGQGNAMQRNVPSSNKQQASTPQQVQNSQPAANESVLPKAGDAGAAESIEIGGLSGMDFFKMLNGGGGAFIQEGIPAQSVENQVVEEDYQLDYEDIDARLEKQANEDMKKREIEDQLLQMQSLQEIEEKQLQESEKKLKEKIEDSQEKESESSKQSQQAQQKIVEEAKEARQIVLNTVVQSEFQDEESSDEDNDDTFGVTAEITHNNQHVEKNQDIMDQIRRDMDTMRDSLNNQNQKKSSLISAGIIQPVNQKDEDTQQRSQPIPQQSSLFQPSFGFYQEHQGIQRMQEQQYQQFQQQSVFNQFMNPTSNNRNYQIPSQQAPQGLFYTGNEEMKLFLDPQEQSSAATQDIHLKKYESSDSDNDDPDTNPAKNSSYEKDPQELLEELMMKQTGDQEDAEDMCATFLQANEEDRKQQEEKRKERLGRNTQKISEILGHQEEEQQNYFSAVAHWLQASTCDPIWIYKDDQGNQQGPFESIKMDQWKEHFENIEVSYSKQIFWIKYKDLTNFCKRYSEIIKGLIANSSGQKNQQQQPSQAAQQQQLQQMQQYQRSQDNHRDYRLPQQVSGQYEQQQRQQQVSKQQEGNTEGNSAMAQFLIQSQSQQQQLQQNQSQQQSAGINPQLFFSQVAQQQQYLQQLKSQKQPQQQQQNKGFKPQQQQILANSSGALGANFQNPNMSSPSWLMSQQQQQSQQFYPYSNQQRQQGQQMQWSSGQQQQQHQNNPFLQQAQANSAIQNQQKFQKASHKKKNSQHNNSVSNTQQVLNTNNPSVLNQNAQQQQQQHHANKNSQNNFYYQNNNRSQNIVIDNVNPNGNNLLNQRQGGEYNQRTNNTAINQNSHSYNNGNNQRTNNNSNYQNSNNINNARGPNPAMQGNNNRPRHARIESANISSSSQMNQNLGSNEQQSAAGANKVDKNKKQPFYEQDFPSLS